MYRDASTCVSHTQATGRPFVRDITEAKRTEDSLRDSEARSNALLEDAPQGIIVVNDDGVIIRVNRQLEKMFGFNREELMGSSVEILIPESLKANHINHRRGYVTEPVSRPMGAGLRLMGRRNDGSELPVDIGLSTVDTSDGHLTIAHISDDTHRRDLEDSQRTRETQLSGQLEAREAEIELVDQVAKIITFTLDIDLVFAEFADKIGNLVDFNHASIMVVDHEAGKLLVNRDLRTGSLETPPPTVWDLKGTQTERLLHTGQTTIQDDLGELTDFSTDAYLKSAGIRSTILTPLAYNDRIIGSMLLASRKARAFGPKEQRIVERLASQIAPAVENARLYEDAVSRTPQLECLLELAEILGQTIPFEEKVSQVLEQLVEVADGYSAQFRVPDAVSDRLVLYASAGAPDDPGFQRPVRVGAGSLAVKAIEQGYPLVVNNYRNNPRSPSFLEQIGDRSVVFLPISAGGRSAGLVAVDSKELDHFTPERVRLLTAIGDGLGTLLENSRLSRRNSSLGPKRWPWWTK